MTFALRHIHGICGTVYVLRITVLQFSTHGLDTDDMERFCWFKFKFKYFLNNIVYIIITVTEQPFKHNNICARLFRSSNSLDTFVLLNTSTNNYGNKNLR